MEIDIGLEMSGMHAREEEKIKKKKYQGIPKRTIGQNFSVQNFLVSRYILFNKGTYAKTSPKAKNCLGHINVIPTHKIPIPYMQ